MQWTQVYWKPGPSDSPGIIAWRCPQIPGQHVAEEGEKAGWGGEARVGMKLLIQDFWALEP